MCSKSCNSKRKSTAKQHQEDGGGNDSDSEDTSASSSLSSSSPKPIIYDKKALRIQHKEAVKAKKQERRMKRMGNAPKEVGRKPCDLCDTEVDLLIRCTIDEGQLYKMVCGKCWPAVSGGVPDGVSSTHPHYNYGGLWKNRNADLKKRVGSGSGNNKQGKNTVIEEIEHSAR